MLTPLDFAQKWSKTKTLERAAAQEHFIDLCRLLEEPTPAEADPEGRWYAFEYGTKKAGGGKGWADVWKRGHFGWEYKSKGKDLEAAFRQLQLYAPALEYPPLLVVSDIDRIILHTAFTGTPQTTHILTLDDLAQPEGLRLLRWTFREPDRLRPGITTQEITAEAAGRFAGLAQALRGRGHSPQAVAHFLNRLLFCLFAEDVDLLPRKLVTRLLANGLKAPQHSTELLRQLFVAMRQGGTFGVEVIDWFNGGLFDDDSVLPLTLEDMKSLLDLAHMDWSAISPSVFGTLFERGLDPDKRSQLGAHYTDPDSIMRIIEPVIVRPLWAEWEGVRETIVRALEKAEKARNASAATKQRTSAQNALNGFLERLKGFRVLDPACGSGNFLYLALRALKDLEHRVNIDAEALGLPRGFPQVGPEAVRGIELNPYAAELARVTVWIGEIQWMLDHGFNFNRSPVLRSLDTIECRDAVLNPDGTEASWPAADVIVGNPPFLGDKMMIGGLGEAYVKALRQTYKGRVPGGADLVCYWFEKARAALAEGQTRRAGLVTTNSIRGGQNRKVLERIREIGVIFDAWDDEPWINEGAAVRVSLVNFASASDPAAAMVCLDGQSVKEIYADLTPQTIGGDSKLDLTEARALPENAGNAFQGTIKVGAFDIPGNIARQWLKLPNNPNGQPNSDVLRPWANGMDVTRRYSGTWIIDFGIYCQKEAACLYEVPFQYLTEQVAAQRAQVRDQRSHAKWWMLHRPRPDMRQALAQLDRYIATPRVAKYRLFVWMDRAVLPDSRLYAIARHDDTSFGILHSRIHERWSLATCSWHGVGNDPTYNAHSCFETFPFPEGLTPNIPAADYASDPRAQAIAEAARRLVELRDNWLNPPEWVRREPEVVPGYPDRLIPVDEQAARELKKRTLTNLYNQRPAWLVNAHRTLDEAVAAAYGWPADLTDEEILRRLLTLNLERVGK